MSKTNVSIIESSEKLAKKLEVREIEQKETHYLINYWTAHHMWSENFAEYNSMTSSNNINKKSRTSDFSQSDKDERSSSYSQNRKNEEVSKQYTTTYKRHILIKNLDMNSLKDEKLISEKSKILCINFQRIIHKIIEFIIF